MKRTCFFRFVLLFTAVCLFTNRGLAQDYKPHATLTGHTRSVTSVAFSPDGNTLASGGWDKTIRLWNVQTGKLLNTLIGHTHDVRSVAFSPDGQTLASGSSDKTIRLWNVQTGRLINTFTGHTDTVWSVAFTPDGQTLASGSWDKTVRLWNVQTGRLINILVGRHPGGVHSMAFSPNGQTLASGSSDKTIRLWNVQTGKPINILVGHTNWVNSVAFSPDGRTLTSSSWDKTVRLWNVQTGRLRNTFTGHTDTVWGVAFSPDGQTLASGGWDNTIRLWNVQTGSLQNTLTGHTNWVQSVAFSPDKQTLASGSSDNTIRLWKMSISGAAKESTERSLEVSTILPYKSSAERTYDTAIRAVMWIVTPGVGTGSGLLIDKQFGLAVTNAHVTGTQSSVDVYFPAPDGNGELINDRGFYVENREVLKQLGYYMRGQIVARNTETDLAIIKLDRLPETAREIVWDFKGSGAKAGDIVYVLGNPSGQELWRWTLGEYLGDTGDFLYIQSDVLGGNSGGPVLNKQGSLLGIVARSDNLMNALAIPVREVTQLLSESGLEHSRGQQ